MIKNLPKKYFSNVKKVILKRAATPYFGAEINPLIYLFFNFVM